MEDLITIIVPIYKVEKYLDRCVKSIIDQTYKNTEIILVDDGSPDNCPNMCDEYAKIDNRIRVIHKKNGGLSDARNAGIAMASGKYIGFVDSDDFIDKRFYEKLYKMITEYNADIAVCDFKRFNDNEIIKDSDKGTKIHIEMLGQEEYVKRFMKIGYSKTEYYAWNKLYKREVICKGQYPKGLTSEDVLGTYKAILKANKIVKTNDKYYFYRYNEESITGKFSEKDFDLIKVWDLLVEYTKVNAKQYLEYAVINRKRINFTLLYRMAKYYSSNELKTNDRVTSLLKDLKEDEKYLLKSNIAFSRKVAIFLFCKDYYLFAKLLKG